MRKIFVKRFYEDVRVRFTVQHSDFDIVERYSDRVLVFIKMLDGRSKFGHNMFVMEEELNLDVARPGIKVYKHEQSPNFDFISEPLMYMQQIEIPYHAMKRDKQEEHLIEDNPYRVSFHIDDSCCVFIAQ